PALPISGGPCGARPWMAAVSSRDRRSPHEWLAARPGGDPPMLEGTIAWPDDLAERYRREGWWQEVGIFDVLAEAARRAPGKAAIVTRDRRLSYAEVLRDVKRLAARLRSLGIGPRDRVVVQLPNIPEFITVYFALARIGAIPVMALRAHRQAEVRHFLAA